MTRQAFDDLVHRIEARYASRPAALERATVRWIAFGLAGAVSWVALLLILGTAAFAAGIVLLEPAAGIWLLGVGVLLMVYALSQAGMLLLVELTPPDGRAVQTGEAPELAALLDALERELVCRPFDDVRITMDFNAGVREVPRLGLFGWPRTVLEIGLPLAMALTPDELRAVLAHEFAHHSARHGRTAGRIYRLNRTWTNLFERMQRPVSGQLDRRVRWAITTFVRWYWPRLHARALVLSRAQEYHADRVAAEVAGSAVVASALWRMECVCPLLSERFWPDLYQEAKQSPEPPADVTNRLRIAFATPPAPEAADRWIERGLSRATSNDETHPAFPDRARALGLSADDIRRGGFPTAPQPSAAEAFLGAALAPIERELAAQWHRGTLAAWRERHRRASAEARRQERSGASTTSTVPEDTTALWDAARNAADRDGLAAAAPLARAVLERDPSHAGARTMLGHHLVTQGDPEGERLLWQVVDQADEAWLPLACESLQSHYRATGQTDRLREVRARHDRHEAEIAAAQRERSTIRPGDTFLPHGLSEEEVERLRALLASLPDCGSAWLVRKELRHFPQRALFVLCVRAKPGRWGFGSAERDRELVKRLLSRVELPGQVLIVAKQGGFRKLAARIMARPEARIYPGDRPAVPSPTPSAATAG